MKVICAPDKFKGSLTALEAANAMARAARRVLPADAKVDICPVADGGEGFSSVIAAASPAVEKSHTVSGPGSEPLEARYFLLIHSGAAVIEMASAAGLTLLPDHRRDPTRTTTLGVGQLIAAALGAGARQVILGIGGSATNDAGCGAAQALGVRFFDRAGDLIVDPITGGMLESIARIDLGGAHPGLRGRLAIACDVDNPMTGPRGAAAVYAPQKGASPAQVEQLDRGMRHLAQVIRAQLGVDVEPLPGAGAAGGIGAGMAAFFGATLHKGVDLVLDAIDFRERLKGAALVLTGEGRLDAQSLSGKACIGVARCARDAGVPTIALVGAASLDAQRALDQGLTAFHVIGPGLAPEESIRRADELLESAAARVVSEFIRASN